MDELTNTLPPAQPECTVRMAHGSFRSEHGTMIVETAVVLPVFCMLLFGMFTVTMALISYCSATYAVNLGARYASLNSNTSLSPVTTTQIADVVKQNLFMPGTPPNPVVLVYYGNRSGTIAGNYVGDYVGVSVIAFSEQIKIPFGPSRTFELEVQAYRFITR